MSAGKKQTVYIRDHYQSLEGPEFTFTDAQLPDRLLYAIHAAESLGFDVIIETGMDDEGDEVFKLQAVTHEIEVEE